MRVRVGFVVLAFGLALAAGAFALAETAPAPNLQYRAFAPALSVAEVLPTPTPTPRPLPYGGPVASMYLDRARITSRWPIEMRDTTIVRGQETFQDPSTPDRIAWYARFGQPGFIGANSLFAGHINYVGFGNGPFAFLTSAAVDDALYLVMANNDTYAYTVKSVQLVSLAELENGAMDAFVFPILAPHVERVTLISCGGDFVPRAGGGGDYVSRVILVAERYVP